MTARHWKVLAVNAHPEATFEHEHEALGPLGVELERITPRDDAELIAAARDVGAVERRRLMGRQIAAVLQGQVPVGVVNPAVLPVWQERWTPVGGRATPGR